MLRYFKMKIHEGGGQQNNLGCFFKVVLILLLLFIEWAYLIYIQGVPKSSCAAFTKLLKFITLYIWSY